MEFPPAKGASQETITKELTVKCITGKAIKKHIFFLPPRNMLNSRVDWLERLGW